MVSSQRIEDRQAACTGHGNQWHVTDMPRHNVAAIVLKRDLQGLRRLTFNRCRTATAGAVKSIIGDTDCGIEWFQAYEFVDRFSIRKLQQVRRYLDGVGDDDFILANRTQLQWSDESVLGTKRTAAQFVLVRLLIGNQRRDSIVRHIRIGSNRD